MVRHFHYGTMGAHINRRAELDRRRVEKERKARILMTDGEVSESDLEAAKARIIAAAKKEEGGAA
jgi:hypothetical protein